MADSQQYRDAPFKNGLKQSEKAHLLSDRTEKAQGSGDCTV